jgi:hypothetical protein
LEVVVQPHPLFLPPLQLQLGIFLALALPLLLPPHTLPLECIPFLDFFFKKNGYFSTSFFKKIKI